VADDAPGKRQAVLLGGRVPVREGRSTTDPATALDRVDRHLPHPAQVDHQAVRGHRRTRRCVRAAADRQLEVVGSREHDGFGDVGRAGGSDDQSGAPVDAAVPDGARLVVPGSARLQDLAFDPRPQ
jgi:hypothetical protein